MADILLEVDRLGKSFGVLRVLNDVSFNAEANGSPCIGPSGSGKSICPGNQFPEPPTEGEIRLAKANRLPPRACAGRVISKMPALPKPVYSAYADRADKGTARGALRLADEIFAAWPRRRRGR